jgi:transcriptional regulator with XRE-family HTH domain
MIIGDRLREMREEKKLSQGDIEKRSRVAFVEGRGRRIR